MAALDSPELKTLKECTPQLVTALKGVDRGLVYFLNQEGFITDDVADKVLNPVTLLTEADKAWELVKCIKNRVKLDPSGYHVLLGRLNQSGNVHKPIVRILEAEFVKQNLPVGPTLSSSLFSSYSSQPPTHQPSNPPSQTPPPHTYPPSESEPSLPPSSHQHAMQQLVAMGFTDEALNSRLLLQYNNDLYCVVNELVQIKQPTPSVQPPVLHSNPSSSHPQTANGHHPLVYDNISQTREHMQGRYQNGDQVQQTTSTHSGMQTQGVNGHQTKILVGGHSQTAAYTQPHRSNGGQKHPGGCDTDPYQQGVTGQHGHLSDGMQGSTGNHGNTQPPMSTQAPGLITDIQHFSQMYPERSYLDAFNEVLLDIKNSIVGSVDGLCDSAISKKLMTHAEKSHILESNNQHKQASCFLDNIAPKIEVDPSVLVLLMNMLSGLRLRPCDQIVLRIKKNLEVKRREH